MTSVSIVTPFLNAEAHLLDAINSVRAQTFPDWELLLIDDGSTDASVAIAAEAARNDSRVRLIQRPADAPRGAAAARNRGIAAARGGFVAFLDADDVLQPSMLDVTLAAMDKHPSAAMVTGPTLWWHPDGSRPDWLEPHDGRAGRLHPPLTLLRSIILLQQGQVPCTCSVLIRRQALDAVGGFEEKLCLYEDQTLWVKLFCRYHTFVTPVCLSKYRQHPGSVSAKARQSGAYDRMKEHPARAEFLAWVGEYLKLEDVQDRRLLRALRVAQAPYSTEANITDRLQLAAYRRAWRLRGRFRRRLERLQDFLKRGGFLAQPISPDEGALRLPGETSADTSTVQKPGCLASPASSHSSAPSIGKAPSARGRSSRPAGEDS